jgi:hypothetical protein
MKHKDLAITPAHWGPSTWTFLHFLTLSYPVQPTDQDRQIHRQFLISFAQILPCEICREHFRTRIQKCIEEGALDSRDTYVRCMWQIHRDVNPAKSLSFKEFIHLYKNLLKRGHLNPIREMEDAKRWKQISAILGITTVALTAYLIYKKS